MTILSLLIVCALVALGVWVAGRCPPPINLVVWIVLALVVIAALLQATGLLGPGVLSRRI